MSRRLPALVAALGLASVLTVLTAPPTIAAPTQPQTLQFETTPPEGAAWWNPNSGNPRAFRYLAWATASSGLFPSYSIDPASSGVCWISQFPTSSPGIGFSGPGTCTIHVDQPGNDEYLPAPRVSQSFVIEKVQPELTVLRKTNSLTRKRTFSATLTVPTWFNDFVSGQWGYADQVVTFWVARQACVLRYDERRGSRDLCRDPQAARLVEVRVHSHLCRRRALQARLQAGPHQAGHEPGLA